MDAIDAPLCHIKVTACVWMGCDTNTNPANKAISFEWRDLLSSFMTGVAKVRLTSQQTKRDAHRWTVRLKR